MLMIGKENCSKEFSLYFHIPFCTRKCDYCHFYVLPDKEKLHDQLFEALLWEWKKNLPLMQGKILASIYFGGGTPSLFGPKRIEYLLNVVNASGIVISPHVEITLEANPERIRLDLMRDYATAGINRVSVGIQSLDNSLLTYLGRLHDADTAKRAIHTIYEAGISNITVDLMYDLPNQTIKHWKDTLSEIEFLPITHLSLYNLTIEPHTVFFKKKSALALLLPDADSSLMMYQMALEQLPSYGLLQYEISAFAKPGFHSKHNTGYWTGRPFLGFGPSAFSFWEGSRFQNVANLSKYYHALEKGESPVDFREMLDPDAKRRELLVIRLRLNEGINLKQFENDYGPLEKATMNCINNLIDKKLLEWCQGNLKLTAQGILYHDTIASDLI